MKKRLPLLFILCAATSFFMAIPAAFAATVSVKLPYARGESFVLSQGYDSPPTHIKKDAYALDFTQNSCQAYGKAVVAAASGKAMFVSEEGYNGGYGTELIIDHGNDIVSRYAHMIPGSITVALHDEIRQGEIVGHVGDTGLVAGAACADHPGTHLHFAMDTVNADGTFTAYDPEPISGFVNMTEERWYLSDNGEDDTNESVGDNRTVAPLIDASDTDVATVVNETSSVVIAPTTTVAITSAVAVNAIPLIGGVSITSPLPMSVSAPASSSDNPNINNTIGASSTTDVTASTSISTSIATTTIATTTDAATTTIATTTIITTTATSTTPTSTTLVATTTTTTATSSIDVATSTPSPILFQQLNDTANSPGSFYDDNWFDLGNGFAGTLNALTLEGKVNDSQYFASHLWLQEFKDPNYTGLIQQFTISDNAPFTATMATATFSGLSIPLKPYLYYRLATIQDWQNRSVILAGTPTTTVGVVMWDYFIPGAGGVQSTSTFFPYMVMEGSAALAPLAAPPLTSPTDLTANFDEIGMQLGLSFSTSTDPDWPANPLHYEMNYSTSSSLSDGGWTSVGSIPVTIGNSYLIGVRALDNFGDVSAPVTIIWNFPPGFSPYLLGPATSYAYQYFNVPTTSTLRSITLFTTNFQTGAKYPDGPYCTLELYDSYDLSSYGMTPSDNSYNGYGCIGNPTFSFASSSLVLYPGHHYQWIFKVDGASVQFYGTTIDTAGGLFSDPPLINARFVVNGDSGVLFEN
jgi:hypothetical protein